MKNEVIAAKLDSVITWVKKIDGKVDITNGKVNQNKTDIALIRQSLKTHTDDSNNRLDWSRKKLIKEYGVKLTAVALFILFLIQFGVQMLVEYMKGRI